MEATYTRVGGTRCGDGCRPEGEHSDRSHTKPLEIRTHVLLLLTVVASSVLIGMQRRRSLFGQENTLNDYSVFLEPAASMTKK
jgi:hypothetical protein